MKGLIAALAIISLSMCQVAYGEAIRWDVVVSYRCPGRIVTATYRHKSLRAARRTKATLDRWERAVRVYIRRVS